jgi:hypothetical protein
MIGCFVWTVEITSVCSFHFPIQIIGGKQLIHLNGRQMLIYLISIDIGIIVAFRTSLPCFYVCLFIL